MNKNKEKILVTGANGFIGKNLINKLIKYDCKIFTFTYPGTKVYLPDKKIENFNVDISDSQKVGETINKIKPNKVFHLAAVIKNDRTFEAAEEVFKANLVGSINLIKSLHNVGCKRIINMSTCEVYGPSKNAFVETQKLNPISPYSISKASIDSFCIMLNQEKKLPVVTLRFTLVYGPYQTDSMLIPQVIISALKGRDFSMTEGEQTRNFVYVDDAIDALIKASNIKNIEGKVFNIGGEEEISIRELVERIIFLMGNPIKPIFGNKPYRNPEIWRYRCTARKAREVLKWRMITKLDDGLIKTINWHKERFDKIK